MNRKADNLKPVTNDSGKVNQPAGSREQSLSSLPKNPAMLLVTVLVVTLVALPLSALIGYLLPDYSVTVFGFQLVIGLAGLVVMGLLLATARRQWTKPLEELRHWSQRIRAGDLYTPIPCPRSGAFERVIGDINNLSDELNNLTDEMDVRVRAKTEHIAAKSRSLEILYDIATDLSTARNLDELLEQFLDTMMVLVDAKAATVRIKTDEHTTRLVASHGLSQKVIKQEQVVDLERCLCGQISQHGGFGIQSGMDTCNQFLDCSIVDVECRELVVVPLQYRDEILGVYNLFLDRPSSELGRDVRDLLYSIGKHLGLAIEKLKLDGSERRLAIMEERNMIGNELHDSLAQSLVSMRLQIKMLGEQLHNDDKRGAQNEVRRLKAAVDEAHESLRELLANFKSRISERGLVASIGDQVLRFREETGVSVFLQNDWNEFTFTPIQEVQIYRIIQEALTNIRKHSNAQNVRVMLYHGDENTIDVLVEDDGTGIDNDGKNTGRAGENIGLQIMQERAERLRGTLVVESETGEGTQVKLSCPLHDNDKPQTDKKVIEQSARITH